MTALVHLGRITPSGRRNAAGSADHDYVREYIKLKRWALKTYGEHDRKAPDNTKLPRIPRGTAIQMAAWWDEVSQDIDRGYQAGNEVVRGNHKMQVAAYGSGEAARLKRAPTGPALTDELLTAEAIFFWEGMSDVSRAIGSAKLHPSLFDKGVFLLESVIDSAEELPGRLFDAATVIPRQIIQAGKDIGDDVQAGIDKLVKAAKWTGIIGGGLLATYIVTRLVPPAREDSEP